MYLDHAASSGCLAPEALLRMRELLRVPLGNPSSAHAEGRAARRILREARSEVASALGAEFEEVVFTSGVTEALQIAVGGLLSPVGGLPVVTSIYDHKAVVAALRGTGRSVVQVEPGQAVECALRVFSCVSNELGWLLGPLWPEQGPGPGSRARAGARSGDGSSSSSSDGALLRDRAPGLSLNPDLARAPARDPGPGLGPLIVDCAQGALYAPEIWQMADVSALTLPSHKLGGPTGVGLLLVRKGQPFITTLRGGPQENELRAGTEAVIAIAGFARRLSTLMKARQEILAHLEAVSETFKARLKQNVRGVRIVTDERPHAPGIIALQIVGVGARTLVDALDAAGVQLSAKSACGSHSDLLQLKGVSRERSIETFRVSFHYDETLEAAAHAADVIAKAAKTLRGELAA